MRYRKHIVCLINLLLAIFLLTPASYVYAQKTSVKKVVHTKKKPAKKKRSQKKPVHKRSKINYRKKPVVDTAIGYASFYADKFNGRKTASGERFSQKKLTCAHNTYPLGSTVRVTNLANNQSVILRVTDRLHHNNPRLVDLSKAAAAKIGFSKRGVIKVKVERLTPEQVGTTKDSLSK